MRKHCCMLVHTARTAALALSLLPPLAGITVPAAHASVVLNGTRVIYQAGQHGKTLQLSNEDEHPNLVQMWVDDDAPFVLNPPIFRMEPHAGQMVRLRIADTDLPQDRESVFYLNFTQVPALDDAAQQANRLVLLFQSRVKLFYRPKGLAPNTFSCAALHMQRHAGELQVENTSAYHLVVMHAELRSGDTSLPLAETQMLTPFSKTQWAWPASVRASGLETVVLTLRNDYGADVKHECVVV